MQDIPQSSIELDSYPGWCGYLAETVRALLVRGDDIDRNLAMFALANYDLWRTTPSEVAS